MCMYLFLELFFLFFGKLRRKRKSWDFFGSLTFTLAEKILITRKGNYMSDFWIIVHNFGEQEEEETKK